MNIIRHIPNTITSMNLLSGLVGVVFAFGSKIDLAFYCMIAAAFFDFLDGFVARLLGAYSQMGKELDSLCDVVSFGVLPSIMLYSQMRLSLFGENFWCWLPLLLAVFSALRLAKFNIDDRQKDGFLGLPAPACALIVGALTCYIAHTPTSFLTIWAASDWFLPAVAIALGLLMLSEIPMFSLKFHKDDSRVLRTKRLAFAVLVSASVLLCVLLSLHWSLAVLISMLCYVVKNILYASLKI